MKPVYLWASGLLLYMLAVVWMVPAALLDRSLNNFSEGRVRLSAAQGTVWSGEGQLEIRNANAASVATKSLQWKLDRRQLLFIRLGWELSFAANAPVSTLKAGWDGIEIKTLDLKLPATVAEVIPQIAGYGLGGLLHLYADKLVFKQESMEGRATIQWDDASTDLVQVSPLGSYVFQLDGAGPDINVSLNTLQGPLQLEGAGTLVIGGRPFFSAVARVAPGEREVLAPFLRLIAVEGNDGSFVLHSK